MPRTAKAISACALVLLFGCSKENPTVSAPNSVSSSTTSTTVVPDSVVVNHGIASTAESLQEASEQSQLSGKPVDLVVDGGIVEQDPGDRCAAAVTITTTPEMIYVVPRIAGNIPDLNSLKGTVHLDVDLGRKVSVEFPTASIDHKPVVNDVARDILKTANESCTVWQRDIAPGL